MPRCCENYVAGGLRLDPKAVNGSTRYVYERTAARPNPGLVTDVERDLAVDDVEGLHVVSVQVQRDARRTLRLLVDQGERLSCLVPRGEEVRGRLPHPAKLCRLGLIDRASLDGADVHVL